MAERRLSGTIPFSQRFILSRLDYDQETGHLTWRPRPASDFKDNAARNAGSEAARWNKRYAGRRAGHAPSGQRLDKYRKVRLLGRSYYEHRLVWIMVYGAEPDSHIDHINGDPTDNRLSNLRLAAPSDNSANTRATWGSSRYRGVSKGQYGNWRASVTYKGERVTNDRLSCETAAAIWRDQAALRMAGEFARLNVNGDRNDGSVERRGIARNAARG